MDPKGCHSVIKGQNCTMYIIVERLKAVNFHFSLGLSLPVDEKYFLKVSTNIANFDKGNVDCNHLY